VELSLTPLSFILSVFHRFLHPSPFFPACLINKIDEAHINRYESIFLKDNLLDHRFAIKSID